MATSFCLSVLVLIYIHRAQKTSLEDPENFDDFEDDEEDEEV